MRWCIVESDSQIIMEILLPLLATLDFQRASLAESYFTTWMDFDFDFNDWEEKSKIPGNILWFNY